jgi:purine-nucleoside phosphorylase
VAEPRRLRRTPPTCVQRAAQQSMDGPTSPRVLRMSTHIGAEPGQIASTVLLPGDPLRAKWIAERFLDDATRYSEVRGMYGFTGTWQGQRVSVQGSGMGQPSMSIYVNELFQEYDVRRIVRAGSCVALTERLAVRDVVIASGACTDSSLNRLRFHGLDYAAVADFDLLRAAHDAAAARDDVTAHVGLLFSGDSFYSPRPELMKPMVDHGVLAVEMETSALYTLAASYGRQALAICTVSDHIVTGEETTSQEREQTFGAMVDIALTAALAAAAQGQA